MEMLMIKATRIYLIHILVLFVLTTTTSTASENDCISNCLNENTADWFGYKSVEPHGSNKAYVECLATCQVYTDQCTQPTNSSGPVCSPSLLDIEETPRRHMIVPWQPCSHGLYAVTGYNITITGDDLFECYTLSLNFTLNNTETKFAMISDARLKYTSNYKVLVDSLPYNPKWRADEIEYKSRDCTQWYSISSCQCAIEEIKKTYASDFVVDNFSHKVSVAFQRLPSCYSLDRLLVQLKLLAKNNDTTFDKKIDNNKYQVGAMEIGNVTFDEVFPPTKGLRMIAEISGIYQDGTSISFATSKTLHIEAKAPMIPRLCKTDNKTSNPLNNVYYICYEAFHTYPAYILQVRQCTNEICQIVKTLDINQATIQSNITSENQSSFSYYLNMEGMQNGVYLVRVRENRPSTSFSSLLHPALWSGEHKINHFLYYEPDTPPTSVFVSTISILLLCAVAIFAVGFYLCRKDFCRAYMSGEMHEKLKMFVTSQQQADMLQQKLWLVWLMDHRTPALNDSHSQVIRDLAAYLRVVCGIDVVLDLYEEDRVAEGVSSWMQSSHERSQFVVLVCPHYSYNDVQTKHSFLGDFDKSFKYLEPFLANKVKYITVNLPYSDPNCSDGAKWLHKTTTKYSLMDQIEDFYFHVQGCSNFDLAGKHSAEFIDHKNFVKTNEGATLQQSIATFCDLQEKYHNIDGKVDQEKDFAVVTTTDDDDATTTYIEIPDENRKELQVSLLKIKKPVVIEDAFVCDDFDEVLQPPPLLSHDDEDPEERLRLLNGLY